MKTIKKTKVFAISAILLGSLVFMAFTLPQDDPDEWEIPSKYKNMENPYKDDNSIIKFGKMLYAKHCKSCHGNRGQGDGPKAKQLETHCGDFTLQEFQDQADGVIYYKSFIGRDEMPNFESKIPDEEDRWAIVNYMRRMGK